MHELSPFDDYPYHQAVAPQAVAATSDSHFNDGYYFAWYQPGAHWFMGLRRHPNNNVMDGYAGVVSGGRQRSIRVTRALHPDPDTLQVGPLSVQIVEPMTRQRLVLDSNDTGLGFDVTVDAVADPHVEHGHTQYRHGRLLNHLIRYTQLSRVAGTITDSGEAQTFSDWFGCRDHSWGIRSTMGPHVPIRGTASKPLDPRAIRIWIPFDAGDHSGFFHTHEDRFGNTLDIEGRIDFPDADSVAVTAVSHSFEYHPGTRRLSGGAFTLTDSAGGTHDYIFQSSCDPAHPQGFGYTRGWEDGGQPGVYRGEYYEETDDFVVNDPAHSLGPAHVPEGRRLGGTEFTCTLQGPGGSGGMAHVEHMIYGPYEPYGIT
ncbi:MAG: hypothetical protein GY720_06860 [bacterium]|nr:hypothetical protein [bacterium]